MKNPLVLLFSLALTAAVVYTLGWPALFGFMAVALGSILFSSGPPQTQPWDEEEREEPAPRSVRRARAPAPGYSYDKAGWYYPMEEIGPILAANATSPAELTAATPQMH